jgi:hypothetical protein
MIHVFFVPGMFGSMIEMSLRAFTDLDGGVEPQLKSDGSAHTFQKQFHFCSFDSKDCLPAQTSVTTPIYPFAQASLPMILDWFSRSAPTWSTDKKILVHAADKKWAEINMLFQWYKISIGLKRDLEIFGSNANGNDIKRWNPEYTDWSDMHRWEYREWLSIFYPTWVNEWIDSRHQVSDDFLTMTNQSLIDDTGESLEKIIDFCHLRLVKDLTNFAREFRQKQQYVLDEYDTIERIVDSVLQKQSFSWNTLSIVGEAILQQLFRSRGFEWRCDGLDELPTNSIKLHDYIYQPDEMIHA